MFRCTIRADEHTDVDAEISMLQKHCQEARLPVEESEVITRDVGSLLRDFVDRAKQLSAIGSQMRVVRDIRGNGYSVRLVVSANEKRSLTQKVWAAITGR